MSKKVYKNAASEQIMKKLYDKQLASLNINFEDIYLNTRFGKTHLIKTGNPDGKPILLFHGGNSTAPYYLKGFLYLKYKHLIYAVDTIGHPGKSDQNVLSAINLEYGEWASDVISGLGFKEIICIGGSFGGGILAKLMCVAPQKISKAILLVPSGICNVSTFSIIYKLGIPMILYIITKNEKWLKKSILPMTVDEKEIDEETLKMVRETFNHVSVKAVMPSNVKKKYMDNYDAPTLLIAGEKDILFPGNKIINRAKEIIPNLKTYLMKDSGHLINLSSDKHKYVLELISMFLEED